MQRKRTDSVHRKSCHELYVSSTRMDRKRWTKSALTIFYLVNLENFLRDTPQHFATACKVCDLRNIFLRTSEQIFSPMFQPVWLN